MGHFKSLLVALAVYAAGGLTNPLAAAPTSYPLTLDNCGAKVTFQKAPQHAIGLGQNSVEIMLLLRLQERMADTAFLPSKVLPQLAEANAKVRLLTVEFPTLESMLAERPDFVAAALPSLLGPSSKVAKREDFELSCLDTKGSRDAYGSRAHLWSMEILYQEIDELSRIFDVADRGQTLIADFRSARWRCAPA